MICVRPLLGHLFAVSPTRSRVSAAQQESQGAIKVTSSSYLLLVDTHIPAPKVLHLLHLFTFQSEI